MEALTLKSIVKKALAYRMPQEAKELLIENYPVIVSGVTASGKNTVIQKLEGYEHIISHTNRHPRAGEAEGSPYHFVDTNTAIKMIDGHKFIEVKPVHGDTIYGTSIEAYRRVVGFCKKPLLEIDVQGAQDLMAIFPEIRPIFLIQKSFDVLIHRLQGRGEISQEDLIKRLKSGSGEIRAALCNENFQIVVNDNLEETTKDVEGRVATPRMTDSGVIEIAQKLLQDIESYLENHK